MNANYRSRYELAVETARKAGQLAFRYFDQQLTVEWKNDRSPVTVADRETEQLLRTTLLQAFPNDGFLGEESGDVPGSSGYRWIIDPIDGTRNFVRGIPLWATLVGLEYKGVQIAGVVEVPALGHTYHAILGGGAFRGDQPIHVSDVRELSSANLFYSSISWFVKAGCQDAFLQLAARTQRQRGFGDFYGFVLVAQGSGELMVEHGVHPWDVAAVRPIVEEAGGRMNNWDGRFNVLKPDVIASNGLLHDEARSILQARPLAPDFVP